MEDIHIIRKENTIRFTQNDKQFCLLKKGVRA